MEKEFVPYELAVKLKALDYDEPCFATYDEDRNFELQDFLQTYETFPSHIVAAPTFSQAFRWFREKHNCSHAINKTYGGQYIPYVNGEELDLDSELNEIEGYKWLYTSYEEAELACLTKLIEIVETKSA